MHHRARQFSVAAVISLLAATFAMIVFAPIAAADDEAPLAFVDSTTLTIAPGASATLEIVNTTPTAQPLTVTATYDNGPSSPPFVVTMNDPGSAALPDGGALDPLEGGGRTILKVTAGGSQGSGTIVVAGSRSVIRRAVNVATTVTPALTSWTTSVSEMPWSRTAALGSLPLASGQTCARGQLATATLAAEGHPVKLTASCANPGDTSVALEATAESFPPGTYKGTLPLGGKDVAIEFIRRAPLGLAIATLLAGIVIGLLVRGQAGRRVIRQVRTKQIVDPDNRLPVLPDVSAQTPPLWWKTLASKAVAESQADWKKRLDTLWAGWQRIPIRWLFVPSTAATATLEEIKAESDAAEAILQDWADHVQEICGQLATVFEPLEWLAPSLHTRAKQLAAGDAVMTPPVENGSPARPNRRGISGLGEALVEMRALLSVAEIARRVKIMDLATAGPGPVKPVDLAEAQRESLRAKARLEVNGLMTALHRAIDAEILLLAGLSERTRQVALMTDQIVPPPSENDLRRLDWIEALPQMWPEVGERLRVLVRRNRVIIGDLVGVAITLLVVLIAGLTSLYIGKPWGTGWDIAVALIAAVGGTLTIAPLVAAIDRLGGTEEQPA